MRKHKVYTFAAVLALIAGNGTASAQNSLQDVLSGVERNNPSIKAALLELEAGEYGNRSEIMLDNPEFEFNYLLSPETGNRHDVRITQSLDFGLLSGQKSKLMAGRNELLALEFKSERQEILLEAELVCIDLTYYNALCNELEVHLSNAEQLVSAYERKVSLGGASVLELNNVRLHRSTVKGQLMKAQVERAKLQKELERLNGNAPVEFNCDDMSKLSIVGSEAIDGDFESFFENMAELSPALGYARQQIEVNKRQLGVDKTAWVPDLTVGYMSEITQPEAYRGLTFGISIPLWSNSSKVKQSRSQYAAAQARNNETVQAFRTALLNSYNEAVSLREISMDYRNSLEEADNRSFLIKAENQGEISIIEYITEMDLYYDNLGETLSAEREYLQTLAGLTSVLL